MNAAYLSTIVELIDGYIFNYNCCGMPCFYDQLSIAESGR
ncbi:MAG: hypothetical protein OFPII_21680 [Osedax symbiont Rs1]|nr:MAG: hypothetical protein OFPII_21680 [Osedax symbiont Rs1]